MTQPIDFNTSTWKQVSEWAAGEISRLRTKNDGDLDELQTASVRGEIKALKRLLALPDFQAALAVNADPA